MQPTVREHGTPGEHGLVSMAVAQERIHANAAHLYVLHPRSACCVALWSCVFGCFERVVSYVGLRQHSRVSKLHDTCRNKWRRWCAGRVNCNQVCRALSMRPSHLAQQKRHRPTECGHRLKALGAPTMCAFAGKSLPDASPRCAPDLVPSILAPTCRHPQ